MARIEAARVLQQRHRPVAVLHGGRMGVQHEGAPAGVGDGVALAPPHLLARVVAARTARLGGAHALAVHHRRARAGAAARPLAVGRDQGEVQRLPRAGVAQPREPAVGGAPRRQVGGQRPPRARAPQHVEDRVHDLAQRPAPRPPATARHGQQRLQHRPFARRSGRFHSADPRGYAARGWSGSTCGLRQGFDNLPKTTAAPAIQPPTACSRPVPRRTLRNASSE